MGNHSSLLPPSSLKILFASIRAASSICTLKLIVHAFHSCTWQATNFHIWCLLFANHMHRDNSIFYLTMSSIEITMSKRSSVSTERCCLIYRSVLMWEKETANHWLSAKHEDTFKSGSSLCTNIAIKSSIPGQRMSVLAKAFARAGKSLMKFFLLMVWISFVLSPND